MPMYQSPRRWVAFDDAIEKAWDSARVLDEQKQKITNSQLQERWQKDKGIWDESFGKLERWHTDLVLEERRVFGMDVYDVW